MNKVRKVLDFEIVVYLIMTLFIPLFVIKGFTHEPSTGKHLFYVVGFALIFASVLLRKKKISFNFTYVHLAFLGIGFAALLSLITVALENPQYFQYSLEVALYTLFLVFSAVYISNKFDTIDKIELTLLFFILGASVVSIDALLNFYVGWDIFLGKVGEPLMRGSARSTIGNPNFVSDYMGMTIPAIFYFVISRKPLSFIFKGFKGQLLFKSLLVGLLIPMVASVFVAQTRTVITAIFLGNVLFLVTYLFLKKNKKPEVSDDAEGKKLRKLSLIFIFLTLIVIAVIAVLYLTPSPLTGNGKINITSRLEYALTSSGSWKERFSAWYNSLFQWLDESNRLRIPFGTGIGTFQLYHLLYSPQVLSNNPDFMPVWNNFKRTHNDYIQGLGELGLVGFIFIVLLVGLLVVRFFRVFLHIDNKRDLLLYGALGAGIFSFAAHSFFEFPLHMQPNLMLAVFITSLAMGTYFNSDLKRKTVSRIFLAIAVLGLSAVLIFQKTSAFLGEGFFRLGQSDQQYYLAYYGQTQKLNVTSLQTARTKLNAFSGEYAYLSNVQTYMEVKGNALKSKYPGANPVELLELAERERASELSSLQNEINNRLRQYDVLTEKATEYYDSAIENFKFSNRIYPVFGKPLWYLAGLGTKPQRLEQSKNNPELMKQVLTGTSQYTSDIIESFKGSLEVIPLPDRQIRTLPLKKIMSEHSELFDQPDLVSELQLNFITQLQMIIDSINYYESSFILFSERQTPRILGRLYASINGELKKYIDYVAPKKALIEKTFGDSKEFLRLLGEVISEAGNRALYWFDLAVRLLPGTWNRYPDWEDIYLEYMNSIPVLVQDPLVQRELILSVARKHVWASENMGPDSPEDTLGYAMSWGDKNLSGEELETYKDELRRVYEKVVRLNRELYDSTPQLSQEKRDEIEELVRLYESL